MTATYDAVDLCAGPGGWDVAAARLGLNVLGFEIDDAAILTRDAAGHHTATVACPITKATPRGVRGLSMTEVNPRDYAPTRLADMAAASMLSFGRGAGQIASPPCQGFSMAGKGQARQDSERLLAELAAVYTLTDLQRVLDGCAQWMTHPGTALVLEPLRWALTNLPSWGAWEQVPAVLPIWEACAVILRRCGYSVAAGYVHAEQYGVPQTRKRAALLFRAPWLVVAQLGEVALPTPTHSKYHQHDPSRLDPGVPRWVSMAHVLKPRGLAVRFGAQGNSAARTADQPSATITGAHDYGQRVWLPDGAPLASQEAAALQAFPADYPFMGGKRQVAAQIGNAVPPILAEALLRAVLAL